MAINKHENALVQFEINAPETKVSIDKREFFKSKNQKRELRKFKKQWKQDMLHSTKHHQDRDDLIKHFMQCQAPNWGNISFSLISNF